MYTKTKRRVAWHHWLMAMWATWGLSAGSSMASGNNWFFLGYIPTTAFAVMAVAASRSQS